MTGRWAESKRFLVSADRVGPSGRLRDHAERLTLLVKGQVGSSIGANPWRPLTVDWSCVMMIMGVMPLKLNESFNRQVKVRVPTALTDRDQQGRVHNSAQKANTSTTTEF